MRSDEHDEHDAAALGIHRRGEDGDRIDPRDAPRGDRHSRNDLRQRSDRSGCALLAKETGVTVRATNEQVAQDSDVLVLAVKPQSMSEVLQGLRASVTPEHLVISIAAGVSLGTLAAGLGADRRLARVMPNTPALVGEGAAGYCLGPVRGNRTIASSAPASSRSASPFAFPRRSWTR